MIELLDFCGVVVIMYWLTQAFCNEPLSDYYAEGYKFAAGALLSGKWDADTTWSSDCTSYDDGVQQALRDWKALNTHRTIERRKHRGKQNE